MPILEQFLVQVTKIGFPCSLLFSDNFQSSAKCVRYDDCFTFGPGQGQWASKETFKGKNHKVKAAWTITEDYRVVFLRRHVWLSG